MIKPYIPPEHLRPITISSELGFQRVNKRKVFTPDTLFESLERDAELQSVDKEWLRRVKIRLNELKRQNREFGRIGAEKRKDLKKFVAELVDITYDTTAFSQVQDGRLITFVKRSDLNKRLKNRIEVTSEK